MFKPIVYFNVKVYIFHEILHMFNPVVAVEKSIFHDILNMFNPVVAVEKSTYLMTF